MVHALGRIMRVKVDGYEQEMQLPKAHEMSDAGAVVEVRDGRGKWRSIDIIYPRLVQRGGEIGI